MLHRPRGVFFVDTLGIHPRIRIEWESRVTFLPRAAWSERDVRAPGVFYTIAPITTWGQFARVQVTTSERFPREPDEAPRGFASGVTYWLMKVEGQWVAVAAIGWVSCHHARRPFPQPLADALRHSRRNHGRPRRCLR